MDNKVTNTEDVIDEEDSDNKKDGDNKKEDQVTKRALCMILYSMHGRQDLQFYRLNTPYDSKPLEKNMVLYAKGFYKLIWFYVSINAQLTIIDLIFQIRSQTNDYKSSNNLLLSCILATFQPRYLHLQFQSYLAQRIATKNIILFYFLFPLIFYLIYHSCYYYSQLQMDYTTAKLILSLAIFVNRDI